MSSFLIVVACSFAPGKHLTPTTAQSPLPWRGSLEPSLNTWVHPSVFISWQTLYSFVISRVLCQCSNTVVLLTWCWKSWSMAPCKPGRCSSTELRPSPELFQIWLCSPVPLKILPVRVWSEGVQLWTQIISFTNFWTWHKWKTFPDLIFHVGLPWLSGFLSSLHVCSPTV